MIRIPQVRVVDEEGAQLGVMPTPQALEMAQERGLDLVEVAPMASPPVVKFLDFGQYKYELTKRDKEAKRKQRSVTFKEVRLKPKIGVGDFDTKVRRAIQFLEEGDRIKVAVQFRGRELTHPEIGRALLAKFAEQIKDHGAVERAPLLEGKSMHITVASTHKPKVIEHVSKHPTELDATAPTEADVEPSTTTDAVQAPAAPAPIPAADAPAPGARQVAAAVPTQAAPAEPAEVEVPSEAVVPTTTAPAPTEAAPEAAAVVAPTEALPKTAAKPSVTVGVAKAPASPAAGPKTARAKAPPKTATNDGPATVAAAETKPAPRPARIRKTTESGAPAPASAGE